MIENQLMGGAIFAISGLLIMFFNRYFARSRGWLGEGEPRSLKELVGAKKAKKGMFIVGVAIFLVGLILLILVSLNINIGLY